MIQRPAAPAPASNTDLRDAMTDDRVGDPLVLGYVRLNMVARLWRQLPEAVRRASLAGVEGRYSYVW
jgi:hypothetical protein